MRAAKKLGTANPYRFTPHDPVPLCCAIMRYLGSQRWRCDYCKAQVELIVVTHPAERSR